MRWLAPFPLDLPERSAKPRHVGLTHVLDKGLTPAETGRPAGHVRRLRRRVEVRLGHRLRRPPRGGQARPPRPARRPRLPGGHAAGGGVGPTAGRRPPRLGRRRRLPVRGGVPGGGAHEHRGQARDHPGGGVGVHHPVRGGGQEPHRPHAADAVGGGGGGRPRRRRPVGDRRGPGERHRRDLQRRRDRCGRTCWPRWSAPPAAPSGWCSRRPARTSRRGSSAASGRRSTWPTSR